MKIETDKYLYIFSVICGLLFVYFISVYVLLVIVVLISYLYYASDRTTLSFKLRVQKKLNNFWYSSSVLTSLDSMYQQNSLATYRLNRSRTLSNSHRSPSMMSSRENDAENTSFGASRSEYESKSFNYRSSDETMFSTFKLSPRTSNRSFSTTRRSTPPNSPWGISVSPKLRNNTSGVRTVQTVAGPLLASTRFNRSLDSGLFGNISSPGLSSRIAHSARENAEILTHQKKYDRPGDFPLVQLDRSASRLPTLSPRNTRKLFRTPVTVRIAPPESTELRYSALLDRSPQSLGGTDHDTSPTADQSTKSLLEVLKEISRKRIHSQMEEKEDEVKRQCKGETSLANGEQQSRLTPVLNDISGCKRMREESPEDQNVEQKNGQARKRINNNNEILSSLSSSRNLLKFMKKSAKKRKSTVELLANSAPVAKKQSRQESPSEPTSVNAGNAASSSDKENATLSATVNSATSSDKNIAATINSSPGRVYDSARFSEITQMTRGNLSPKFIADEEMSQQRIKKLLDSIENEGSAINRSARFSLSRAPTLPGRRIPLFSEDKVADSTKITSDDSKTSNTEVKDSHSSITKSPSSTNVFGLATSVPNTTPHSNPTPSFISVSASAPTVQTSTAQSAGSAIPGQSSPFCGLTSPALVASTLNASLKTSDQPTTKTDINISPSFMSSTSASNVNTQTFSTSMPAQSSTTINFGATQTTAAIPNSLSSVKSSTFATSSAEQPIQTSSANAPTSTLQVSTALPDNNKNAEMIKSSSQMMFGTVSAKDSIAVGSAQLQATQAATLFSSTQAQPTQASSVFGASSLAQSTPSSQQVQSTQGVIAFGSSPSTQASTESAAQLKSSFSVPQTSQQSSTGSVFPPVQSSALFGTSPSSSSLQSQAALSFGVSASSKPAQTSIFGSKQTDLFKTSSANQPLEAGKTFGTSSSVGVQPAQTTTEFSSSPVGTATQVSVFGNSGTTQTTAGSNLFASTSVVSSTQGEVKSSTALITKPSFTLPSASFAFGSSVSPAQNTGGFQIAKSTSETDSGVGASIATAASSGFGSGSSKPSPAQNTFSFGGTTPAPASQTTTIFGTQAAPKSTTQASLSFGGSTSQPSGAFGATQTGTAISGGFGALSGSVAKPTTESNAATGKSIFASASVNTTTNNTPVFGTQTTNVNVFGGTKADEKAAFGFGSAKPNDSSTNIFQPNTISNQSNVGGFKFDFTSPATTKENTTATPSVHTTAPAFQFGASGESKPAFGFGSASSINNTLKPAVGGFGSNVFGSTPNTTNSAAPQSNVFSFGGGSNPSSGTASSNNNAFAFGTSSSAPSTTGAFTFGSTSQPSSSNVFGFGSAQTKTSNAQNASSGGGMFSTGTSPAFQFGNSSSQAGSAGGFGFGSSSSGTAVNFAAGSSSGSNAFQQGSTGGFGFGSSGSSATPNFTAGPSTSSSTFQPGTTGNMFSIGSGSTGPRARARTSRRQRWI